MPAQVRGGLPAVLFVAFMLVGSSAPFLDSSSEFVSADSLPSWPKLLRMHEGVPSAPGDYDWLNTSEPQNLADLDYDDDSRPGITIRKGLPNDKNRHFWVLDPAVNSAVTIQGDMTACVWARADLNISGYTMIVQISDIAPGDVSLPDSWVLLGEAMIDIQGPWYNEFSPHYLTVPLAGSYDLLEGHRLVVTIKRGDDLNSGSIYVVYDATAFDSYIIVPLEDFVSVSDAWAEDAESVPRDTFSDTEVMTIRANISDPFGSYDISGAECVVRNSSDGSVVVPATSMAQSLVDPDTDSSWAVFTLDVGPLAGGSYLVTVTGSDPTGSPTWLNFSISVISVDHLSVSTPSVVTAWSEFEMTITALDSLGAVVPEWRGTVGLSAFQIDLVSPANGSLSVLSAEFTGAENGTVTITNQTYDLGEDTIVIRAESESRVAWSDPVMVRSGPVFSIVLEPGEVSEMLSGLTQTFNATAYDANGLENSTWTPSWTVEGGIGTIEPSGLSAVLLATSPGTGYVMCEDPVTGVNASASVTVVAGSIDHIVVSPAGPVNVREGEPMTFTAVGYDLSDNEVPLSSPTWYTDTSGTISGSGSTVTYTAGYIPETGTVTVSVGSISASVTVTVTTALNGPWLSTIPTQIVNEDSTWTLSLTSYWNHVNGTSYLRWYAEGVDTSLYMVTHDPSSDALVSFITQPDEFGIDTFRLWVRDPDGFSAYQDIVVSIQPVNDLPAYVHSPPTEFYVKFNTPYSFDFDYHVSDVDNDKDDLSMSASSSDWGEITFDGLVSSFLFVEKDGRTSYFETAKLTLTDAASGVPVDSSNSVYLSVVVWVTEDTPPSLDRDLPDIDYLKEGDMDVMVFDLDEYFSDVDEDFLIYEYGFQNIEVFINKTTHEVFMSAPYEWSGVTDGTFTAVDPIGAFKADTVTVTVAPVNDAPSVSNIDDVQVRYDTPYILDADLYVNDPDHSFSELDFTFSSPYVSYADKDIVLNFPANPSGGPYAGSYVVDVTMTVEDPEGASGSNGFKVTVSDNYPPALTSPLPYPDILSFAEDSYLNGSLDMDILFIDLDDGSLQYDVECLSGNENICAVIYPDGIVNFTAAANWSGYEVVQFRASDTHGAWISWSVTIVVTPVNDAPVVKQIDDVRLVGWPRSFQMFIVQYISDIETPYSELVISASPESYVSAVGEYLYVTLPEDINEVPVTIYAVDSDGAQSGSVTFNITIARTTADVIGYPYSLPLVILAAAVAGYFIASRIPKPYSIENLFLIHNDGRLVAHITRQENTNIDKDVVSAMFTAVQEFVRDSFQAGEIGLKKLEIGDKNVLIEKGGSVYVAMIYTGWPPKDKLASIAVLLRDIEERYGERISRWNGTMKTVKGVEAMLQSFMENEFKAGSWVSEEEMGEAEWVDILSKEQ
ncbi:MAG: hypothetical protein AB7S97_00580 [Thermoplasmata archaeon]